MGGSRTGQRDKLSCNAVATKTSGDPVESSGMGQPFRVVLTEGREQVCVPGINQPLDVNCLRGHIATHYLGLIAVSEEGLSCELSSCQCFQ